MTRPNTEPRRCTCASSANGLSTHRAARHDGRCPHSTLRATTKRYQRQSYRRIPGTRGYTPALDR